MEQDIVGAEEDILHHHVLVPLEQRHPAASGLDRPAPPVPGRWEYGPSCGLFDHVLGLRRSCSEEWFWRGGCGVLGLIVGVPCSPLSRLISSRKRWFSAWAARRSAMTSSSRLSSRLTSSRARSSAMLYRSRSSSISPLAPGEGGCAYRELLCQLSPVVATRQGMGFQPRIIEEIRSCHQFELGKFKPSRA